MIEDRRRENATDFDVKDRNNNLNRDLISPLDMGKMLNDDDLDNLCDEVLTDLTHLATQQDK